MIIIFRNYCIINLLFLINLFLEPLTKLSEILSPPALPCFPCFWGVIFVLQLQTFDEFGVGAISFESCLVLILLFIYRPHSFLPRLFNIKDLE